MRSLLQTTGCVLTGVVVAAAAHAQDPQAAADAGVAEYRSMLAEGNPAELYLDKGEDLWKSARGPKNASLQRCDLGQRPGVVKGAYVTLPRYFKDTGRVQDLESRLLSCMETLQGIPAKSIIATPFGQGEQKNIEALVAWIASESNGMKVAVPQDHPEERRLYDMGRKAFFLRAGPMDFACSTCHSQPGKRIRLQEVPDFRQRTSDAVGFGVWPAYRVSTGELWTMQRRINDCFRQQRFPYPGYTSDAVTALMVYMGVNDRGATAALPGLKR